MKIFEILINIFYLSLIIGSFILMQFTLLNNTDFFYIIFYIVIFLISILCFFKKWNFLYIIGAIFLFIGWNMSYLHCQNVISFIYYCLAVLLITAGKIFNNKLSRQKTEIVYDKNYRFGFIGFFLLVVLTIIFSFFPFFMRYYIIKIFNDSSLEWFIPLRHLSVAANLSQIGPKVFNEYEKLFWVILFIIVLIYLNYLILKDKIKNEKVFLCILFTIAFISKIIIVNLSSDGLKTIGYKIAALIDNPYFQTAVDIKNPFDFMKEFVEEYQMGKKGVSHIKGHPILPVIFYWFLTRITFANAFFTGIVFGLIASLSVIPLYYITKLLFNNSKVGFFVCLFYSLGPVNTILSFAGIDSINLLFILIFLCFYLYGIERNKSVFFLISGFSFAVAINLSFAPVPLLIVPFAYYFSKIKFNIKEIFSLMKNNFIFLISFLFVIFLLFVFSSGKYYYLNSLEVSRKVVSDVCPRPYALWWWANIIHWSMYVGVASIALFIYRYVLSIYNKISMDIFSLLSFLIIIIFHISGINRAETHRILLFISFFVYIVAIIPLFFISKKRINLNNNLLNIFIIINFLNSVIIEIFITDTH